MARFGGQVASLNSANNHSIRTPRPSWRAQRDEDRSRMAGVRDAQRAVERERAKLAGGATLDMVVSRRDRGPYRLIDEELERVIPVLERLHGRLQ